jgi:hypothetical protein
MPSFQIGADNFKKLLRRFFIEGIWVLFSIDEMAAHMIFNDFSHKACHRTARAGNQMQDLIAAGLAIQRAFNRLNLPSNSTNPPQELLFLVDCVTHALNIGYPPILYKA